MTYSNGLSLRSLASIALLMSYSDALKIVSLPRLTVLKKEAPFNMTIFP
jgi:hypothetical protein